jgi:hypothetical protein
VLEKRELRILLLEKRECYYYYYCRREGQTELRRVGGRERCGEDAGKRLTIEETEYYETEYRNYAT